MKNSMIVAFFMFGLLGVGSVNAEDVTASFLSRNCTIRKAYGIGAQINLKMFCGGHLRLSRRDTLNIDLGKLKVSSLEISSLYVTSEYRVSAAIVLIAGKNTKQIIFQNNKLRFSGGNIINQSSSIVCIDKMGSSGVDVIVEGNDFDMRNFTIFNNKKRGC